MSFAPYPAPHPGRARRPHHGIQPLRALYARHDWGEQALQRTWRTVSIVCLLLGFGNAFVARVPALIFALAGVWAHVKANPTFGARVAAHPVLGAPWRWWLRRGHRPRPAQAPDTTPQL